MQDDVVNLEIVEDVSTMEFTPRESVASFCKSDIYIYIWVYITTEKLSRFSNKSVYRTCRQQLTHFLMLLSIASHNCECLRCFRNIDLASYAKMVHFK